MNEPGYARLHKCSVSDKFTRKFHTISKGKNPKKSQSKESLVSLRDNFNYLHKVLYMQALKLSVRGARLLSQEVDHSGVFAFKKPPSLSPDSGLAHTFPLSARRRTKPGAREWMERKKETSSGSHFHWTIFRQRQP